jgi:hypothetical protein
MYQLVFTQKVDGSFINHQSIEIPNYSIPVKHNFKSNKSYAEYLKVSKECEERVIQFKKEQLEFNKKKGIDSRIQEVRTAKKIYNLAISSLLQIQTCD